MGNNTSTPTPTPSTPASSFFNLANPVPRPRIRRSTTQNQVLYPRRSIFAPDEHEPDDFASAHDPVLLGWTRTEQGIVIPQIRSIPLPTPLDDTIFNSPRLPWIERTRDRSPVPSARSIPRMRQFSIESFRDVAKRELRVINVTGTETIASIDERSSLLNYTDHEVTEAEDADESDADSFNWNAIPTSVDRFKVNMEEGECMPSVTLKRGNSTNDSGYSTMAADTGSCTDESVDPWWWEEAAGYSTNCFDYTDLSPFPATTSEEGFQYLHEERQESAYLSNLLRSQPFDEWTEWSKDVTKIFSKETITCEPRPVTPLKLSEQVAPRSPGRRRSLFNFAKKIAITKRRSVLW